MEINGPGVCMPGERLAASITFTNEAAAAATVAWAGAQLHCQLVCREDVVRTDLNSLLSTSPAACTDTAFIPNRGKLTMVKSLLCLSGTDVCLPQCPKV